MAAPGSDHLAETGNFLWPAPPAVSVGIQARLMSETRLRLCSEATLHKERRERAPSIVLAQILQRLSGPGSLAAATGWESCLGIDLSIENAVAAPEVACLHPAGRTEDAAACHRRARRRLCHRKPVFRRGPAHPYLHGATLRWWAMSVGFGDKQPCPRRSKHSSDSAARHCRGRGTACWRTATRIDPQCRHFAIDTGPYPTDVVDGVSRSLAEAVPPQFARPDPAPARPLSQSQGDLGIDLDMT
ncbi:hypothetical protein ABIB08_003547 [Bradyrhizobium sp. RT11b]